MDLVVSCRAKSLDGRRRDDGQIRAHDRNRERQIEPIGETIADEGRELIHPCLDRVVRRDDIDSPPPRKALSCSNTAGTLSRSSPSIVSGMPLHRIAVYSFGEEQPVADAGSREGRARNRRVVVKVLE